VNIHDIARVTVIAEHALAELTDMSPADRMQFLAVLQGRLIDAGLKSAADSQPSADSRRPAPSALEAPGRGFLSKPYRSGDAVVGGFQLRALTPRAVPMVDAIEVLARLPHTGDM